MSWNPNKKSVNSDETELWYTSNAYDDVARIYRSIQDEAIFLEETIFRECCVADRNVNLVDLDWIGEVNLEQFTDETEPARYVLSSLLMRKIW
ncbi:unnamed protein product [Hymenolepis diminuta]|uniref:Uncharacterized protein n=1 Tax=Hymenolepis diminuta TaxID=6216 RepID=A0A564Z5H0_HYMDI|nr:unnamed protein product [Hymenolepis diminuta]